MKSLCALVLMISCLANADSATELLTASDIGRGGIVEGLTWNTKVTTTEDGDTSSRSFLVKAKDHDAYVLATEPVRNQGEIYLFNDRNMWFYKPSVKKPVSISPRQKLSGQAANGDIASTHYARDYTPTFEKSTTLDGEKVSVLLLKAKANNLTYDQIRYFISDKTKLSIRAEFLTLQGETFKIGKLEYKNQLAWHGKSVPFMSRLTITDAKFPENVSVIDYNNPKIENHSPTLFNVNSISR